MTGPRVNLNFRAGTESGVKRIGVHRSLDWFVRLGDGEAKLAVQRIQHLSQTSPVDVEALDAAVVALWHQHSRASLTRAQETLFLKELVDLAHSRHYGVAPTGYVVPALMKDLARPVTEAVELAAHVRHALATLSAAGGARAETIHALQRILGATNLDDVLVRDLVEYAIANRRAIIEVVADLPAKRAALDALRANGASKQLIDEAEKDLQRLLGTLWNVRGILGELCLTRSRQWLTNVRRLVRDAEAYAATLPGTWQVWHLEGRIAFDRKSPGVAGFRPFCDQAVVLVNLENKHPVVMIHTAVQMKVENEVGAFRQLFDDLKRMIGGGVLRFVQATKVYEMEVVPLQDRYMRHVVAYAKGGTRSGVRAAADTPTVEFVTEMTVDGFTNLTADVLDILAAFLRSRP